MCSVNFLVNKFALFTNGYRDVKDVALGLLRMIADSQTEDEYEMNLETLKCLQKCSAGREKWKIKKLDF